MMNYIQGIEIKGKKVLIKRRTTQKFYEVNGLLDSIAEGYNMSSIVKLKGQFYSEYREILKICRLFSVPIDYQIKVQFKKGEDYLVNE